MQNDNRYIPINKGNYTMEPPEREELFEKYRSEGWEEEYRQYRTNWSEYPRRQFIADYPLLVDLELSSICNLRCPMCYTITKEFKDKVGAKLMDIGLFKKIIDEICGKTPAIRLSLRGEPTIHPHFIEAISYAKQRGIKEISTLTNGSRLSRDFFVQAMDAGIDWITISVDGTGAAYEKIRKPLKFGDILQAIKDIKTVKKERGNNRPVIKIQAIWPAIKDNPGQFYNTFAPFTDLIAFNPLIDYLSNDDDIDYEENFSCCQLYQRLVIGADGRALMCSNDEDGSVIIGNANDDKIYDIWHGSKLNQIREIHKQKDMVTSIAACRRCYLPRRTQEKETAVVNERTFRIKNYVNRNQLIGM